MVLLTQFRPPKKPCELAVPSVACPKMLKTFTNLSILTLILGWMRNRCATCKSVDIMMSRMRSSMCANHSLS